MPADHLDDYLDREIERALAGYSRVEPRPEALRRWMQPPAGSPRPRLHLTTWAALVAAMLVLLALAWYRARSPQVTQPTLAGRHTVLVPVKPSSSSPDSADQQKLLKMLQSNPAALAHQAPPASAKKPH